MNDSTKSSNPFDMSKLMTGLDPTEMVEKFTAALSEHQLPGVDVGAILAAQRKNIEALTTANKQALEGIQAVAARQGEILRETMEEASAAMKELSNSGSPSDLATKQGELVRQAFEKALGHMRELAEISAKSNTEAFETIKSRLSESVQEIKGLAKGLKR